MLEPACATWWAAFQRELADASRIQHPSHLTLLDAGVREGRPFLAYEPAFGILLTDADLEPEGLPVGVAAALADSLLDGVAYAQDQGVALGPVGPERILATFDGRFLWMDAGLATTGPAQRAESQRARRVAPESSARRLDPAAERYAVGRLLSALGPTPSPQSGEDVDAWFRALGSLLHSDGAERDLDACRASMRALADAERGSSYVRERHRRVAVRLTAALQRDEIDLSTDLPALSSQTHRGSGRVAGSPAGTSLLGFALERRVPSASPVPLHAAVRGGQSYWLRARTGEIAEGPEPDAAFAREARLAQALSHPGLPALAEPPSPETLLYTREPSVSFAEWLQERPAVTGAWRAPVTSLVDLLEALHREGYVAANVQPAALFVSRRGSALLVDRGFITRPDHLDPWLHENLHALAPEYFGERRHDEASDRFAFGALLYQIFTGTRPFRGLAPQDVVRAMERGPPRPVRSLNATVPRDVADLIDALLDPEPEARPSLRTVRGVVARRSEARAVRA